MTVLAGDRTTVRGPIRLGSRWRLAVNAITAGVWGSGVLWLVFHHFLRRPTEFGPEAHPLEHLWLQLHGAFAFAALWLFGRLSANHIVNGWASRRRRWSGGVMLATGAVLIITGYLLYYAGDEKVRSLASIGHWSLGLGAALIFLWHRCCFGRPLRGERPGAGGAGRRQSKQGSIQT